MTTGREPQLGGQPGPTGREPGLPRLHQQRYEEMGMQELCILMNEQQGRLFMCACAESAMQLMQNIPPIYRDAIKITRRYANQEINFSELKASWEGVKRELQDGYHGIPYCVGHSILCAMRREIYPYSSAFHELVAAGQFWDDTFYESVATRQKARAIKYLTGKVK